MENPRPCVSKGLLSAQELEYYRGWLAELDADAHKSGGNPAFCTGEIWDIFFPFHRAGKQIYRSFSDEELLDIVIRTMNHQGHRPDFNSIYCIYLQYLKLRFGGLDEIKALAKRRMRQLKNEKDWPADWQDRVSIEPMRERMAKSKKELSKEDAALLEKLCIQAKEHGVPLHLDEADKRILDRMGGSGNVLKTMGIPIFKGSELRHMQEYWASEREKQKEAAATERQKGKEL